MSEHETGSDLMRRVAEEATPEVGRFIGTIFGSTSMQLDAMLGERFGWWRFRQAIKLAEKAQKLLDERGLSAQQVPFRTSVPLLEAGSLEDDLDLCDRWAALLANAAREPAEVPPSFPGVLREMEPDSARVLDVLYRDYMGLHEDFRDEYRICFEADEQPPNFRYHVDNLVRLGLVGILPLNQGGRDRYNFLTMTSFGIAFVRACQAPGTPDPPIVWSDRMELQNFVNELDHGVPPYLPEPDAPSS